MVSGFFLVVCVTVSCGKYRQTMQVGKGMCGRTKSDTWDLDESMQGIVLTNRYLLVHNR